MQNWEYLVKQPMPEYLLMNCFHIKIISKIGSVENSRQMTKTRALFFKLYFKSSCGLQINAQHGTGFCMSPTKKKKKQFKILSIQGVTADNSIE